jgi:hypothetical protein
MLNLTCEHCGALIPVADRFMVEHLGAKEIPTVCPKCHLQFTGESRRAAVSTLGKLRAEKAHEDWYQATTEDTRVARGVATAIICVVVVAGLILALVFKLNNW